MRLHCAGRTAAPRRFTTSRTATPSMGLFFKTTLKTEDMQTATQPIDDEDKFFQPLRFLGNVKQRIQGKWRTMRGKPSLAVTDAIVTAGLRTRSHRRRISGKTTSWEEHLMPAQPDVLRDLVENSWEDRLPDAYVTPRDLAENSWEDRLLLGVDEEVMPQSVQQIVVPKAALRSGKRNLAELNWEDHLLPSEAPQLTSVRARKLSETSWEDNLLPPDSKAGTTYEHMDLASWEDHMLP